MNFAKVVWMWDTPGLQEPRSKHVTFPPLEPTGMTKLFESIRLLLHWENVKDAPLVLNLRGITFDVHVQRNLISPLLSLMINN